VFPLDVNDILFTLTLNNSLYKDKIINIVCKIITIKEKKDINLDNISNLLGYMKIEKLHIFSIFKKLEQVNIITSNKGSLVNYTEISKVDFINLLNAKNGNFLDYNKESLYILRNGNFLDIKNLFNSIKDCSVNIGRWRVPEKSYTIPFRF
jgi:hypothetical protein